jgi:hypothetical protein
MEGIHYHAYQRSLTSAVYMINKEDAHISKAEISRKTGTWKAAETGG